MVILLLLLSSETAEATGEDVRESAPVSRVFDKSETFTNYLKRHRLVAFVCMCVCVCIYIPIDINTHTHTYKATMANEESLTNWPRDDRAAGGRILINNIETGLYYYYYTATALVLQQLLLLLIYDSVY